MNDKQLLVRGLRRATYALLAAGLPLTGHAGAWTLPQGNFLIVLPASYQVATEAFDDNGDRVDLPRFEMTEVSPYLEYGVVDSVTAGLQPKYRYVRIDTPSGEETNSGLAETDLFARVRVWGAGEAAFSIQGLVKLPVNPDENDPAALGRDQDDVELSVQYGNRNPGTSGTTFYNVDVGYRKRFEEPDDQAHANLSFGWSGQAWSFAVNLENIIGIGDEQSAADVLTQGPSFRKHNAQLMGAYKLSDDTDLSVGVGTTYAGENIGVSNSAFVALVIR